MKCLDDIDTLISRSLELWPHPDLIKALWTLRAQIVLDVAEERLRLTAPPVEVGEPE